MFLCVYSTFVPPLFTVTAAAAAATTNAVGNYSHNKWLIKNKVALILTAENIHETIKVAAAAAATASSSASSKAQETQPFASVG